MKAKIKLEFTDSLTANEAQAYLFDWLDSYMKKGVIIDYSFEIETKDGIVTDKCFLTNNTVVA